ncbi:hypothetical protein SteCoe_1363 [Stentor coeruleus]|uniref:6-pyruvoyltetrahydropterin synthase n=1 Tax=Stentor coeruleus TaxID=5963 RepID=A0A1R2D215_9CILI|nr:hypothetical protein SteCoe_1363 [Stentor coeruleus]
MSQNIRIEEKSFIGHFNASHFFYGEGLREELHGHNYIMTFKLKTRASTTLNPGLISNLRILIDNLNTKVIVAGDSRSAIPISIEESTKVLLPDGTYYEFPKKDCYLIAGPSSSAECISKHVFDQVKDMLNEDWVKAVVIISEIYEQQDAIFRVKRWNDNNRFS